MYGDVGDDSLIGGSGEDRLDGGDGFDHLFGYLTTEWADGVTDEIFGLYGVTDDGDVDYALGERDEDDQDAETLVPGFDYWNGLRYL